MGGRKMVSMNRTQLVAAVALALCAVVFSDSDSDECWACTDKSQELCDKECKTACNKKGFEKGDLKYEKCFDKCEDACTKKYFEGHCAKVCEEEPEPGPEESRRIIKEHEAEMEKKFQEEEKRKEELRKAGK